MGSSRIHHRTCNLCEAMCGLTFELEDEVVVRVRGDRDDPFSQGYMCPKGPALVQLHDDPDRLRKPQLRTKAGWRELDWEEALDRAAEGLYNLERDFGRDALAVYLGNPVAHNHPVALYGPPFLRALRTKHRYSATSVDQLPQMLVAHLMFGHQLLLPIPDIDRASGLLIVGANPLVSNGSIMSAPGVGRRLRALQARGGRIVVVDPRRSATAELADEHIFIRPGTDALLLLAVLGVILREGREQLGPLTKLVRGIGRIREAVEPFTPEYAAEPTGVPAGQIEALARALARDKTVVYGRVGAATQVFGALTHWAINLLNIFSGALDRPGGAMFTQPAVDVLDLPRGLGIGPGAFGRWHSRVRKLPEFGGELPVATLAEDILAGATLETKPGTAEGEAGSRKPALSPIRGLLTVAGNPVLSTPDGAGLDRAIASLEFMLSIDLYRNETTRHANLILPPTSALERSHYDLVFHIFAVRNTSKWSPPLFTPAADARHDWQIIHGLWTRLLRLRGQDGLIDRSVHALLGRLGPDGLLDLGLRAGPYGRRLPTALGGVARALPGAIGRRMGGDLDLAKLRANPHGIDLGPLEPCLARRLPSARPYVDLAPALLIDDVGRLLRAHPVGAQDWRPPTPARPRFSLIGRRLLRSNNSWMHNLPKLVSGKPACTLLMHPDDARRLALRPGDTVRVRSRVGELCVPLETSDEVMPGVVSLPHGFGHHRKGTKQGVAEAHAGVSINDISDPAAVDLLSGVAVLSGVPVDIELDDSGLDK